MVSGILHTIAYMEGVPVGQIGSDGFRVVADSVEYFVVGIGGVVVRPEFQGKGIPRLLFNEVHAETGGIIGSDIFTLFCPDGLVPYYEKHEYQRFDGKVVCLQFGKKLFLTLTLCRKAVSLKKALLS